MNFVTGSVNIHPQKLTPQVTNAWQLDEQQPGRITNDRKDPRPCEFEHFFNRRPKIQGDHPVVSIRVNSNEITRARNHPYPWTNRPVQDQVKRTAISNQRLSYEVIPIRKS